MAIVVRQIKNIQKLHTLNRMLYVKNLSVYEEESQEFCERTAAFSLSLMVLIVPTVLSIVGSFELTHQFSDGA